MPVFVDGYNLIGRSRKLGLSLEDEDKEVRLVDLIARYRDRKGARGKFLVVFDGRYASLSWRESRSSRRGITIEFTIGLSADDAIVRKVKNAANSRNIEVITSDRELQKKVKLLGARTTSSDEFIERIAAVLIYREDEISDKPDLPDKYEVEEWLKIFSDFDNKPG